MLMIPFYEESLQVVINGIEILISISLKVLRNYLARHLLLEKFFKKTDLRADFQKFMYQANVRYVRVLGTYSLVE